MRIEASEIRSVALPAMLLVYQSYQGADGRHLHFGKLTAYEVRVLAGNKAVYLSVDPKTKVAKHAILKCGNRHARAILNNLSTPSSHVSVTKHKQERGAKLWVPRHDRAKSGYASNVRQLSTACQSDDEYDERIEHLRKIFKSTGEGNFQELGPSLAGF